MRSLRTVLLVLAVIAIGVLVLNLRTVAGNRPVSVKSSGASRPEPVRETPALPAASAVAPSQAEPSAAPDVCDTCGQVHPGRVCAMYGGGKIMTLADLPESKTRTAVEKLPAEAQQRALLQLSRMNFQPSDDGSVRVNAEGAIYYVCTFKNPGSPNPANIPVAEGLTDTGAVTAAASLPMYAPLPITNPPVYHSRPGITNVLFLDFGGHVISNTQWNITEGVSVWHCLPFDTDGDTNTFSDTEQRYIREIWERVAEDYAVFNVDVTTEQPSKWTRNTLHALITKTNDANGVLCPHAGAGGLAYVDIFGQRYCSYNDANCYSPAWINPMSGNSYANAAEAAAHELGHNLGLDHDGVGTNEYYYGHVNGSISWAPIMGAAYSKNVTQWSKGEYYNASRTNEDDLAILSNRLSYLSDDYGDTRTNASVTATTGGLFSVTGRVSRTGDNDYFSFTCIGGTLTVTGATYRCTEGTWGGNGDLVLQLYDAGGSLIASNNPELETKAVITQKVAGGTYYLAISPTGVGNPTNSTPTGYTSYGSIGPYTISGSVPLPDANTNGIPDAWEIQYYGSITNINPNAPASNGINTLLEAYIAGLNPTSAASVFKVNTLGTPDVSGSGFVVQWSAASGRVYSVYWATNLMNSSLPLQTNIFWPQASYTDTVHNANPAGFYRINVRVAE